jgi:hypothetical protein
MRKKLFATLTSLAAGAGLAFGQTEAPAELPSSVPSAAPVAPADIQPVPLAKPTAPSAGAADITPEAKPTATPAAPVLAPIAPIPAGGCSPGCGGPGCVTWVPDETPRAWVNAEYLLWWVKRGPIAVPLASTGSAASLGVLGSGGHPIGPDRFDYKEFNGGRLTAGAWMNKDGNIGVEASGFLLEQNGDGFGLASGAALPVLARPFIDTTTQGPNVRLLGLPGAFAGTLTVNSQSRIWGAEGNSVLRLMNGDTLSADLLSGFRFFDLEENLQIADTARLLANGVTSFDGVGLVAPGTTQVVDRFDTRNYFYGGQVGSRVSFTHGGLFADLTGKVAFGEVREIVLTNGTTTLAGAAPAPATVPGGLLVTSANAGRYTHQEFAVLPEAALRVGYRVCDNVSVHAGYNVLYLSKAVRPGEQIDPTVNPTTVPTSPSFGLPFGPPRPAVPVTSTDFWSHGLTVGLTLQF